MEFYENEKNNLLRRAVNWIVDIIVVLSLAWFTVYAFGTQIQIVGQSMTPVLESEDVVLVNRLIYDIFKPERMDIVVFEREDNKTNVKRVIGLPGEEVQIISGIIYINQEPLQGGDGLDEVALAGIAGKPVKLGADEYFLLGDNRNSSEDSRFANIGNVKREQIIGKVWLKLFPLIDIKLLRTNL